MGARDEEVTNASIASVEQSIEVLRSSFRVAILGIKPESHAESAAFWIPDYLSRLGYQIIPVPVYFPDLTEILGRRCVQRLTDISEPVDIVNLYRRPEHVAQHVEDLIALRPRAVWFQSGLIEMESARRIAEAGITVVHDCIACRRATITPSTEPLPFQAAAWLRSRAV